MRILQLRYFVKVCELGNISLAAERLHISQPAVTKSIKELEAEFNIKLFQRIKNRLVITEDGQFFLDYAKRIIDLLDVVEREMWERSFQKQAVEIGIGSMSSVLISDLIQNFLLTHKDTQLHLHELDHAANMNMLADGGIDLFIDGSSLDDLSPQRHSMRVIKRTRLVLCVNVQHPLARLSEVSIPLVGDYPIILFKAGSGKEHQIMNLFRASSQIPNIILQTLHMDTIDTLIRNNVGSAFLFECIVPNRSYIKTLQITPETSKDIRMVWSNTRPLSKGAEQFIDYVSGQTL